MLNLLNSMRTLNFEIKVDNEELEGFNIAIDETANDFSAYLYKPGCNVKVLILDLPKEMDDGTKVTSKEIMEELNRIVSSNLEVLKYITEFEAANSNYMNADSLDFDDLGIDFTFEDGEDGFNFDSFEE